MSEKAKGQGNGKKKKAIIIGLIILVIVVAVVLALLMWEPKRNVVVTPENAEEVAAQLATEEYVEPGYYTANMETHWHFSKGDAVSKDARVDNVAGNTNAVYFDVFLAGDEKEPIYKSPVIPVGSFLEDIALDTPLEKGDHDCVMVYHLVDDEQETISTLRVAFTITVES